MVVCKVFGFMTGISKLLSELILRVEVECEQVYNAGKSGRRGFYCC